MKGVIDQAVKDMIIARLKEGETVTMVVPNKEFARQLTLAIPKKLRYNLDLSYIDRDISEEEERDE